MRREYLGVPLWGWAAAGTLVVGIYWYRARQSKQKAAAQAQAPQTQTAVGASGVGMDPLLVAYSSGEASGVATYSAGVNTGLSLVDAIMGLAPAASQSSQATAQATVPAGILQGSVGGQPGDFNLVSGTSQNLQLAGQGVQQYEQVSPGTFAPLQPMTGSLGYGVYAPQTYYQVP